ncbi:Photosynthesis system II assembly factor YCF48 [Microbulbifer donghaiensis]|uniref:Photosynthesis system II assembly factor YCF48 n=1 Tax=Microbulbifer donghaiensis TaxID=494016 RepID=A0A1M4WFN1_9GAMM|nr:Photosynthesis system II assembly factor YCF48 [Microbulbifer donghaiensis]
MKASLRGSAVGESSLWVSGTDNTVFRSTDGGVNWRDVSVKAQPLTDFRDIELFDDLTAIVMGVGTGQQSRLYLTEDGGESWQLLYANPDEQGFFDSIAFWDRNRGLILGDPVDGYYVIMATKDGGRSWHRIGRDRVPPLREKEAAFAASGNTLIAGPNGGAWFTTGGFQASVYASEDYGQSWQRSSVPLHQKTQTAGGYALALNRRGDVFVLGGDFQDRPGRYNNLAMFDGDGWQLADNGQHGLRTAMACIESTCVASGKTASDISFNDGVTWQPLPGEGFYTLAAGDQLILGAGADGRVGVLRVSPKR